MHGTHFHVLLEMRQQKIITLFTPRMEKLQTFKQTVKIQTFCTYPCILFENMSITECISSRGGQNDDFRPLTFRPGGGGHGVREQICDILTPASYESLPPLLATQIPTLWIHTSGGGGSGGCSDIRLMLSIRPICKCRCPPLISSSNIV